MRLTPKTDEELASMNLLPDGIYDFEIIESQDDTSNSGNEMIHCKLKVFKSDGSSYILVDDYLVNTDRMQWKIKHFCESVGLEAEYQAGELTGELCFGRSGKVKIATQPAKDGYPPKNTAKDYEVAIGKPKGMGANAPASVRKQPAPAPTPARQVQPASGPIDEEPPF